MTNKSEFVKTVQLYDIVPTSLPKLVDSQKPLLHPQTYNSLNTRAEWSEWISDITPIIIGVLVGQLSELSVANTLSISVASYLLLRIVYANDLRWLIDKNRN